MNIVPTVILEHVFATFFFNVAPKRMFYFAMFIIPPFMEKQNLKPVVPDSAFKWEAKFQHTLRNW